MENSIREEMAAKYEKKIADLKRRQEEEVEEMEEEFEKERKEMRRKMEEEVNRVTEEYEQQLTMVKSVSKALMVLLFLPNLPWP